MIAERDLVTVKTKYRDFDFEELCRVHATMPDLGTPEEERQSWERKRGRAIKIQTPALSPNATQSLCGAKWYRVVDGPMPNCDVCEHIAEIGD